MGSQLRTMAVTHQETIARARAIYAAILSTHRTYQLAAHGLAHIVGQGSPKSRRLQLATTTAQRWGFNNGARVGYILHLQGRVYFTACGWSIFHACQVGYIPRLRGRVYSTVSRLGLRGMRMPYMISNADGSAWNHQDALYDQGC